MLNINGIEVETDKDGYLLHSQQWNEDVARSIAQLESIELTDAHWEVIYLYETFIKNITPPQPSVCW
ncbi:tRNA 2-thiouridine synthesizing protein E [Haemophilus influenzae]|uniref:tRNA 2-thiouridine synthesizing protein E n=1 Tax=Haemophilus influenzae TaxID=727 RepID=A0A2X1RFR3_HAEIF|nr:tRNA 2-thiouridine synthesizing protein E [Haemophilus influenzae]